MFKTNSNVEHSVHGVGQVVTDMGTSVVVRFAQSIEICPPETLTLIPDVYDLLSTTNLSSSLEVLLFSQAQCISSINEQWGVFSMSQIELLPHQLWVCKEAKKKTPCRLLVADDVGLGKTIEAGIILSAFRNMGRFRRILILTPASLVKQWVQRMYSMFDIRMEEYDSSRDNVMDAFWQKYDMVVASIDTLRMDYNNRQERMFTAEPWDLLIVDEAHHLNNDKEQGATLGYKLIQQMLDRNLIDSMIFFTGTPHKGKNFNFLSLMKLLDEDAFDPKLSLNSQLPLLREYMIRNNKYNVTDLHGNLLFTEPIVQPNTYHYSDAEQIFYNTLTTFISSGMAYASHLDDDIKRIVVLVLITMQKLASSSVAAVTRAIRKRLNRQEEVERKHAELKRELEYLSNLDDDSLDDRRAMAEEKLAELANYVVLTEDEKSALQTLLKLADNINKETKIETILQVINDKYPNDQILFFTEYKATQALLMSELMSIYGENSVTFINGDEALEDVKYPDGRVQKKTVTRTSAAEEFNNGQKRFLIATEAAGEGIDLQQNCHILFHVDLPWNPMRLQQRVGRLNRYGQTKQVIVHSLRNPSTVESRIWAKLNEKLAYINSTFGAVMEQKEDMFQLVLGTTSPSMFNDLFAYAPHNADEETLSKWVDTHTSRLGGKDVFEAVQAIAGNAAKFNFSQVSAILPRVDLPDLQPFWSNMMSYKHRQFTETGGGFEFKTPEDWLGFGIRRKYSNIVFSRKLAKGQQNLGVGHVLFDKALTEAHAIKAQVCLTSSKDSIFIFSVQDHFTGKNASRRILGCVISGKEETPTVLLDWELLQRLNNFPLKNVTLLVEPNVEKIHNLEEKCRQCLTTKLKTEKLLPRVPIIKLESLLIAEKLIG